MPIYNGIEFIDESVNSIKSQTYTNWELIIGINGHPPNSDVYKKAMQYESKQVKVVELHPISGKGAALNSMLSYCQYDWISLLDVDDIWHPRKLEHQLPFMTRYDVIGTRCVWFGDATLCPSIPMGDITTFNFLKVNPVINSSCLVRKNLCHWRDDTGGLDDYDMWLRLWRQGKKFYNVPGIFVKHRIHAASAFNAKGNEQNLPALRARYR